MNKVKVVEPIEGLAFLSLQTEDNNMVDIPLSGTQDITGPFIREFKRYLEGEKDNGHLVLSASGEEGRFVVVADEEESYVINKDDKALIICKANVRDIIKACIVSFVSYLDVWANFDVKDEPGNSVNYARALIDRKGMIELAEDEINQYLIGNR